MPIFTRKPSAGDASAASAIGTMSSGGRASGSTSKNDKSSRVARGGSTTVTSETPATSTAASGSVVRGLIRLRVDILQPLQEALDNEPSEDMIPWIDTLTEEAQTQVVQLQQHAETCMENGRFDLMEQIFTYASEFEEVRTRADRWKTAAAQTGISVASGQQLTLPVQDAIRPEALQRSLQVPEIVQAGQQSGTSPTTSSKPTPQSTAHFDAGTFGDWPSPKSPNKAPSQPSIDLQTQKQSSVGPGLLSSPKLAETSRNTPSLSRQQSASSTSKQVSFAVGQVSPGSTRQSTAPANPSQAPPISDMLVLWPSESDLDNQNFFTSDPQVQTAIPTGSTAEASQAQQFSLFQQNKADLASIKPQQQLQEETRTQVAPTPRQEPTSNAPPQSSQLTQSLNLPKQGFSLFDTLTTSLFSTGKQAPPLVETTQQQRTSETSTKQIPETTSKLDMKDSSTSPIFQTLLGSPPASFPSQQVVSSSDYSQKEEDLLKCLRKARNQERLEFEAQTVPTACKALPSCYADHWPSVKQEQPYHSVTRRQQELLQDWNYHEEQQRKEEAEWRQAYVEAKSAVEQARSWIQTGPHGSQAMFSSSTFPATGMDYPPTQSAQVNRFDVRANRSSPAPQTWRPSVSDSTIWHF